MLASVQAHLLRGQGQLLATWQVSLEMKFPNLRKEYLHVQSVVAMCHCLVISSSIIFKTETYHTGCTIFGKCKLFVCQQWMYATFS